MEKKLLEEKNWVLERKSTKLAKLAANDLLPLLLRKCTTSLKIAAVVIAAAPVDDALLFILLLLLLLLAVLVYNWVDKQALFCDLSKD